MAVLAVWLALVTAGFTTLLEYDATPGETAEPPARWPSAAPVGRDPSRPTLVLFAHPHCPCTRATVAELDRVMARCAGRLAASVLFYADPELGREWERTELWNHAASIPGVRAEADPLGEAARRFGAETSGSVVLYAPDGGLLFHGGITASRGHEGDSAGAAAILALVAGETTATRCTPVYGCALRAPRAEESR
jgi:hypothetical protein